MIVVNSGYTYCQRRTGLRLPGSVRIEEEKAMSIDKKSFENVSGETRAKAQNCQSEEELAALAKETGVELSDDQLEALTGGVNWPDCPTYQPGQNAPIPEALSNNPRVVHLIRSNVTL